MKFASPADPGGSNMAHEQSRTAEKDKAPLDAALIKRSFLLFRRAQRAGLLHFVVSMVCLAVTVGGVRVAAHNDKEYRERLTKEIEKALKARHEPRRDEERVGVLAAVLGPLNRADAPATPACGEGGCSSDRVLATFTYLADLAQHEPGSIDAGIARLRERLQGFASSMSDKSWDAWAGGVRRHVAWAAAAIAGKVAHDEPKPAFCDRHLRPTLDMSKPLERLGCEPSASGVSLVVPATLDGSGPGDSSPKYSDGVNRAISLSRLLEDAVDAAVGCVPRKPAADACKRDGGERDALVQAYFISPESVLRIWTRPGSRTSPDLESAGEIRITSVHRLCRQRDRPDDLRAGAFDDPAGRRNTTVARSGVRGRRDSGETDRRRNEQVGSP
jgi:hypothetical protein